MPRLSVVVAGSSPASTAPEVARRLAGRLADGSLELIVATAAAPPPALTGSAVRLLVLPPGTTVPLLRGAGLLAAAGELVALTEDFCLPAPGWAEALLAAHDRREAIAIGGPVAREQGSAADWALTLQEYGRYFPRAKAGPVGRLPGNNVSYKRERLRQRLGRLPAAVIEDELHAELRAAGETLWREPGALVLDASSGAFAAALVALYHHGRLYGASRVRGRRFSARLARVLLGPLAPLPQLARIVAGAVPGYGGEVVRALPWLLPLLAAWAAGESLGALAGEGESGARWK